MTQIKKIQAYAQSIGIADLGFCTAEPNIGYANFIQQRKTESKCYLDTDFSTTSSKVYDPSHYVQGAKTILVIIYPYAMEFSRQDNLTHDQVRISKASISRDYHAQILEQCSHLEAYLQTNYNAKTKAYADMGPLNDKSILLQTGLVKIGRSSLLIHPKFGTRFYIGYILTDLPLELPTVPPLQSPSDYSSFFHPYCQTCGRCAKSCPNQAIVNFGQLTSHRCISYLTQSKHWDTFLDEIDPTLTLDGYVYGCDTCQRVCPLNGISLEDYRRPMLVEPIQSVDELMQLSNRSFKNKFGQTSAGWIGNKRFKRNIQQILKEREGK